MGDNRTVPLQYGHLGHIKYLPDEQTWEFSRKIDRRPYLSLLNGEYDEIFSSKNKQDDEIPTESSIRLPTLDKEDILFKNCPQLAPGLPFSRDLNIPSSVLENITTRWDPQISTTLSVGNTVTRSRQSRTSLVAGFVSSAQPNVVQIVSPRMRSVEWLNRRVNVPVMADGEKALFAENPGRIHHIAFAESLDERSTFMAVRYALTTAIFRPLRLSKPAAPYYAGEETSAWMKAGTATTLNANPIVEIAISSTGGHPHVDVCFNPWYQQEVAIVDAQGNWSIWDLSRWLSHRNVWRARCTKHGAVEHEGSDDSQSPKKPFVNDSWARIMWLGDVHSLLVCRRRKIVIIHLADGITYHPVNLKYLRNSEWIVDVVRSRSNTSDAFILTTLRIVWISLATDEFTASQGPNAPHAKVLLEWFHYRDAEDLGLRLSLLQIGSESSLVLYSQLNPLAQVYRFSYSAIDPSIPVSVADPSMLQLPPGNTESESKTGKRSRDIYNTLVFQEIENSTVDDPSDPSGSQRLIKLLAQRADNTLIESLYVARTAKTEDYSELELFDPSGRAKEDRYPLSTKATEGDFVVDDWYEQPVPLPRHFSLPLSFREKDDTDFPIYVNFSRLYHLLYRDSMMLATLERKKSLESASTSVEHSEESLNAIVTSVTALTLNDILNGEELLLVDIEKSAEAFETIPSKIMERAISSNISLDPAYLRIPYSFRLPSSIMTPGSPTSQFIYDTYNALVQDYISSLSQSLPVNSRISKERIIRNAMVELMFSQVILSRSLPDPVGHKGDQDTSGEIQLHSETENPSTTPPDTTANQKASSGTIEADDVCSTLKRFTSFKCDNAFSPQVKTILSHWETGKDPDTYDWQMASRAARDLEESQTSLRRRRARREKKARQSHAAEVASQASSQNVPTIKKSSVGDALKSRRPRAPPSATQVPDHRELAGGKPMAYYGTAIVSSSEGRAQLPMTQEERGVFGSRDSRKTAIHRHRKKKRAEGF